MDSPQGCAFVFAGLALACLASVAPAQPTPELDLPSCVDGSPPLRLASAAEQARLDAADRKRFHEAAKARYALYQRGGPTPVQVLLLHRGRHWQYVTLQTRRAGGLCFTAVFAADRFDFTPDWVIKYKPRSLLPDD